MKVKELMTAEVRSIPADENLDAATRQLWEGDIGALLVVDESRRPIGVVTDRDIAMSAAINGVPLVQLSAGQCMSGRVHTCREADSVERAAELMREHQVRRLPIVDAEGKLVGVLSLSDLARAASEGRDGKRRRDLAAEVLRTLFAISASATDEVVVELKPKVAKKKRFRAATSEAATSKAATSKAATSKAATPRSAPTRKKKRIVRQSTKKKAAKRTPSR